MAEKIYIVDGYSFLFRAYHSMPPLTNPSGTPVGAVYGFTNMVLKLRKEHNPDYMVIALDSGQKTFRNEIYPEYKANRPPPPEDLIPQFSLVRDAAIAMSISIAEKIGFEADDLIATIAKNAEKEGKQVVIVSSDKDLMQLVNDNVQMYDAMRSRFVSTQQVNEKFGVNPDKVLDVLSLMGDAVDNIPGVPSIGPKTAAELVNEYGSLEQVLDNAHNVKQNKRRQVLIDHKDDALLSKELVALDEEVKIAESIEDYKTRPYLTDDLKTFLSDNGFTSILAKVENAPSKNISADFSKSHDEQNQTPLEQVDTKSFDNIHLKTAEELNEVLKQCLEKPSVSISYVEQVAISICNGEKIYFARVNFTDQEQAVDLLSFAENKNSETISWSQIKQSWDDLMQSRHVSKLLFDAKAFMHNFDGQINACEDISLMNYVANTGLYNGDINQLAKELDIVLPQETDVLGAGRNKITFIDSKDSDLEGYLSARTSLIFIAYPVVLAQLHERKMFKHYFSMEKYLLSVVYRMEKAGAYLDVAFLKKLSADFSIKLQELENTIYKLANEEFNIGSPKQLGEVLFNKLDLKPTKKNTKLSTSVEILEDLSAQGHDIAKQVLEWRHLSKLISTYTDSLPQQVSSSTGRIHTNFNITNTATGRFSSTDPNLQNIPIRTDEGKKIRGAFAAPKGKKIISADYSQIELRLLSHVAGIDALRQAFADGIDIHSLTASQVFGIKLDEVDDLYRRRAKAINFGIIYGISSFGLKERLGISVAEAKEYIENYFARFPGIRQYMEDTKDFCRSHGYVETITGRRCYIKGINDKNGAVRAFSERAAINAPLQGSASDVIKAAMINLDAKISANIIKAETLIQVHDELIFEANEVDAEEAKIKIIDEMQKAFKLSLPLIVEANIGNNWGEVH